MIYRSLKLLIALSSIVTITAPATAGTIKSQIPSLFGDQIFDHSERIGEIGGFYQFKERNTGTYFKDKGLKVGRHKGDIQILGSDWESFPNTRGRVGPVTNSVGIVEFDVSLLNILPNTKITLGLADTRSKQYKSHKQSNFTALPNKIKVYGYAGDGKSSLSDESISAIDIATITTNPGQNVEITSSTPGCLFDCVYNVDVTDFVKDIVNLEKQFAGFRFEPDTTDTNENFGTQAQLLVEDDPLDIIVNSSLMAVPSSVDASNPGKERIDFYFTPYSTLQKGVKLDEVAQALGYEDFNFLQIIEKVPSSVTAFTGTGKRVIHRGTITTPKGTGKFFDPLTGGNLIYSYNDFESLEPSFQSYLNQTQLSKKQLAEAKIRDAKGFFAADNLPFYLDSPRKQSDRKNTTITMLDVPQIGANPKSEFIHFHTMLVGVKNGGTAFDAFNGLSTIWKSNTSCKGSNTTLCSGGINIAASSNGLLPFPVTGGIEITDSSVTFDEFSDDLIAFLTANNGTLIDFDGAIFTPEGSNSSNGENDDSSGFGDNGNGSNSGSQTVPEPSTLLGLGLVIGLGSIYKKNKNTSLPS